MNNKYLFTSESVTEGHPDKIADQITDAILDAVLEKDPYGRVGIEALVSAENIIVAGQIASSYTPDIPKIVRQTIKEIGYTENCYGLNPNCTISIFINGQAKDISIGIDKSLEARTGEKNASLIGAGDQGMMFGYACNETPELMPLPIMLAHQLVRRLTQVRKEKILLYLRPDGKSQVTVEYENGIPKKVTTVIIAVQHHPDASAETLSKDIREKVINYVIADKYLAFDTKYFINSTGRFVEGGPRADVGLNGRKIIVDTYGGVSRHGGGCFSGKDPTKVDRSGSYMARYAAKNIVAAGLADKCEIQIAYAIGVARPVSLMLETFGTEKIPQAKIITLIKESFDFRPGEIINYLKLRRPIYKKTAAYGHFGREEEDFTWEKTDQAEILKTAAYLKKNNEEKKEGYEHLEKITNRGDTQRKAEPILPEVIKKWEQKHFKQIEKVEKTEVEKDAQEKVINAKATLNSKCTFDNFVVGNSNRLAYAACLAVAQSPAKAYNPLFIYGGAGLGKPHLMQAIGNYIIQHNNQNKINILYISAEKFTNELINAIRDDRTVPFREKYRNVDLLLIDDIQFLAGKERVQEEFFHIFNTLYDSNKQIVITSDRPPQEIPNLEDRLISRFECGLTTDIQPPDLETRIAILRKKAQTENLNIPDEVINFIADKIHSNIRQLEGALNKLVAYSTLTKNNLSISLAKEALKDIIPLENKAISIAQIQKATSDYFNIKLSALLSKKRNKDIVTARQIAIYISRELTELSLPAIGEAFGRKDSTTILHSYNKIKNKIEKDKGLKSTIDNLSLKIVNS